MIKGIAKKRGRARLIAGRVRLWEEKLLAPKVDKFGRALPLGKRRVRGWARLPSNKHNKPLGFNRACHPQVAEPTYKQPKYTERITAGASDGLIRIKLLNAKRVTKRLLGLADAGQFALTRNDKIVGYTNDPHHGLKLVNALRDIGDKRWHVLKT